MKTKKVGSSGRLGARYGWKLRKQARAVYDKSRATYECPQCGRMALRRAGTGMWKCSKCGSIFAGGAYSPGATLTGARAEASG